MALHRHSPSDGLLHLMGELAAVRFRNSGIVEQLHQRRRTEFHADLTVPPIFGCRARPRETALAAIAEEKRYERVCRCPT